MDNNFRVSYTILELWAQGRHNDAFKAYLHLPNTITKQMQDGLDYHQKWKNETDSSHRLPAVFDNKLELVNPKTEYKVEVKINDWLTCVGVVDLLDDNLIVEYKTGKVLSSVYINRNQIPMYAYLLAINGISATSGMLLHYNQYTKKADSSYLFITNEKLLETENWIISLASDMYAAINSGEYNLDDISQDQSLNDLDIMMDNLIMEEEDGTD